MGGVFRRTDSDALLLTWCSVPEFDSTSNVVTVQMRLASDGSIEFIYGTTVAATSAVVGVSPGETGIFAAVDVSAAAAGTLAGGSGAIGERFSTQNDLDFVAMARKFYQTHGDDFDQLVLFTNTRTTKAGTFAFEFTVANEVQGIGVDVFDASRNFGSGGRLRSVVNMDRISSYPEDPAQPFLGREQRPERPWPGVRPPLAGVPGVQGRRDELERPPRPRRGALELLLRFRRVSHGRERHRGSRAAAFSGRLAPSRGIRRWIST